MQAMDALDGQVKPMRRGGTTGLGTPDHRQPARDAYEMSLDMAEEHYGPAQEETSLGGVLDAMLRWVNPDGSQNEAIAVEDTTANAQATYTTLRVRAFVHPGPRPVYVRRIHVFEVEDPSRGIFSEYPRDVETAELHWAQALVGRTYRIMVTYADGEVLVREERVPTSEGLFIDMSRMVIVTAIT
jgi:hypothetical protein